MTLSQAFTRFSDAVAHASGRPSAVVLACAIVAAWALSGPLFDWSNTWQLMINTGTTIVTFLMVFLIQSTQNRDGAAVQTKLDELLRAVRARPGFIGIEHLTAEEVEAIRDRCEREAAAAEREGDDEQARALRRTLLNLSSRADRAERTDD